MSIHTLTKEQALHILEVVAYFPYPSIYLQYRNFALFAMFLMTGISKNELLNLTCTDVDIDKLSIFIRGKRNKDRVVPIHNRLAEAIQKYMVVRNKAYKTCPELFASYTHDIGLTDSGLKKLVANIVVASGIAFSVKTLRHTFAMLMVEEGCSIYSLSQLMGHRDIKATLTYLQTHPLYVQEQTAPRPPESLDLLLDCKIE